MEQPLIHLQKTYKWHVSTLILEGFSKGEIEPLSLHDPFHPRLPSVLNPINIWYHDKVFNN